MKVFEVEIKQNEVNEVWSIENVIAKDIDEAIEKTRFYLRERLGKTETDFRISRILESPNGLLV